MNQHNATTQLIEEFNCSLDSLQPDQVLYAFANLVNRSKVKSDSSRAHVVLNAFRSCEQIAVEVGEHPQQGDFPLAIHGVYVKGESYPHGTYLGPMECLTRISRGVQRTSWIANNAQYTDKFREFIRQGSQERKKNVLRWSKSVAELESVGTAWYQDQLAELRRGRHPTETQQYRQELMDLEEASLHWQRTLSHLAQTPDDKTIGPSFIVILFSEFAKP